MAEQSRKALERQEQYLNFIYEKCENRFTEIPCLQKYPSSIKEDKNQAV